MNDVTRKPISATVKRSLFEKSGGVCAYCGKQLSPQNASIDHIVPKYLGGSNDANNLVVSCYECNARKASKHYFEAIARKASHMIEFQAALETIKILLVVDLKESFRAAHNQLLYANIIFAMETYLSGKLISNVMNINRLFRRAVETNPEFKKEKFSLSEIFDRQDSLKPYVEEYLVSQMYHRFEKIKPMYESIFEIIFPTEIDDIFNAINIRHDIVHRNGKNKNGDAVAISNEDVLNLAEIVSKFILCLDERIEAALN